MSIKTAKNQQGHTLIEALIAALVFTGVVLALGTGLTKLIQTFRGINESTAVVTNSAQATSMIQTDLDTAGLNLTYVEDQIFTAYRPMLVAPNAEYQVISSGSGNQIRHLSGQSVLQSQTAFRGNAVVSVECEGCSVSVTETGTNRVWTIERSGSAILVKENNETKASVAASGWQTLKIVFAGAAAPNQTSLCTIAYKNGETTLFQSSSSCTENERTSALTLPTGAVANNYLLDSAEFKQIESASNSPIIKPLLPYFGAKRLVNPVLKTDNGFVIISASERMMRLKSDTPISNSPFVEIQVTGGTPADYDNLMAGYRFLLLADDLGQRSVLFGVVESAAISYYGDDTGYIYGDAISSYNDGSGNAYLYTPSGDYAGYTFKKGSRVITLNPQIEYRYNSTEKVLYRRLGAFGAWETVLTNVANFSFSDLSTSDSSEYDISFDVLSDGIDAAQKSEKVHFKVRPRALNRNFAVK